MITAWRIFVTSWKNLFRNAWLGLATVFVFVMALISVNAVLALNVLLTRVVGVLQDKVDVTITFQPSAPQAVITQAQFYLAGLAQVAKVTVVTPEEALKLFKVRHANDPAMLEALSELKDNPLGAEIIVKAKDAEDYPFLLKAVQNPQYANHIQSRSYDDHQSAIAEVELVADKARMVGAVLIALFALFGMLTAFNAIRVAIYTQREEINIMRLVGASVSFIRMPFILEGIWMGALALVISSGLLAGALYWIEPMLRPTFEGADPGLIGYFITQWPTVIGLQALGMVAVIVLVSWAAVGKYVKR
ncbi:MAG: permease-like cell division protein FtsX [bacterium]|nr:permease-like cell division protein FtsX [bacterium]